MPIIFIIFISIITFIWPAFIKAQDFSLGVFPPIIEITAKSPSNVSTPLQIQNLSDETVLLSISLKPFAPKDSENGSIRYLKDSEVPESYALILQGVRLIDVGSEVKTLSLGPKQKKDLTLNINVPRDLPVRPAGGPAGRQGSAAGDFYFSIIFTSLPASQAKDRNTTEALGGLAVNILLSIGETSQVSGVIQEFSVPIFVEKGPVPFTVRVKNTGKNFIAPKGEIIIKNLLGQKVGRVELLPVNILAGSVRAVPSELETDGALWKENIIIGPYRATLTLALSDSGPLFKKEIFFFAFPGMTIFVILGGLIALLYLYSRIKRKI